MLKIFEYSEIYGYLKCLHGKTFGWKVPGSLACCSLHLISRSQNFQSCKSHSKIYFWRKRSIPDPVRVVECHRLINVIKNFGVITNPSPPSPGGVIYPYKYQSMLNSFELSSLVYLPLQEMPGYSVTDYARFDVSPRKIKESMVIEIGEIIDRGRPMGNKYLVPINDLNNHGLIVGITGGGKTNTCFHILIQLWQKGIPFLVIEPAKTEYRSLLLSDVLRGKLHVFTLGDNSISPFRLNPFEIMPGVSVQTHIDLLKSVFNASFVMYAPMPYVLEQCIHEIYEDKGWNLTTNDNARVYILTPFPL